jgi:hypothetical protein
MGQFHQPNGAERKCPGSHSLASVGAFQFHQQNYAQLHQYAQLENMLNFYALCPAVYASIDLPAQKLLVKCWQN